MNVFKASSATFTNSIFWNNYHDKSTAGHFSRGAWIIDDVSSPALDRAAPASAANEPMPNGARANLGAFSQTTEASKSP